MRKDVATILTSIALVAGFGIVLTSALSSRHAATAKVVELPPIELEKQAVAILGVDGDKFLVKAQESEFVVDPTAVGTESVPLNSGIWYGELSWDDETKTLFHTADGGLDVVEDPIWGQRLRPVSTAFASPVTSFARSSKASYVGLGSSQVYRMAGKDLLEKRLGGGAVSALAFVSERVVATVDEPNDEKKGTLYFLDGDDLTVDYSQPIGQVSRMVAVHGWAFLMVDPQGLWTGRTTEGKMGVDLEIAGDVKLSRNSHDGYVVVSTGSATKLMRLDNSKLATVKNLSRGGILDAAFNDNLLAVIYEATPRQVTLYRIE